jgi:hypothetical protein
MEEERDIFGERGEEEGKRRGVEIGKIVSGSRRGKEFPKKKTPPERRGLLKKESQLSSRNLMGLSINAEGRGKIMRVVFSL